MEVRAVDAQFGGKTGLSLLRDATGAYLSPAGMNKPIEDKVTFGYSQPPQSTSVLPGSSPLTALPSMPPISSNAQVNTSQSQPGLLSPVGSDAATLPPVSAVSYAPMTPEQMEDRQEKIERAKHEASELTTHTVHGLTELIPDGLGENFTRAVLTHL